MFNFTINFDEEQQAKRLYQDLQNLCIGKPYDRAIAFVDGYLGALQDYRDKYQRGYTNWQIMYAGYNIYRYLANKLLQEK